LFEKQTLYARNFRRTGGVKEQLRNGRGINRLPVLFGNRVADAAQDPRENHFLTAESARRREIPRLLPALCR